MPKPKKIYNFIRSDVMRILVTSDTHGDYFSLRKAVLAQPTAEVIIHLGDGKDDTDQIKRDFPDKMLIRVRGNCDFCSDLPKKEIITLEGKKILATHGHIYNVKMGYYTAYTAAREEKADILLFGHTHLAFTDYDDGLYVMNPGSLHGYDGSYGIIDIQQSGVIMNLVKL